MDGQTTSHAVARRSGRGLSRKDFVKVSENGFGDGHNAYAHSMAYYKGHVYAGTSRATMALLGIGDKGGMSDVSLDAWPVEITHRVYTPEFETVQARAEIWRMDPATLVWTRTYQAPMVYGLDGTWMSRDLGYRCMAVFQGDSDDEPALYVTTWSRSRGEGMLILRTVDGLNFEPVGPPGLGGLDATSSRSLVPFKGRLFTSPTGSTAGRQNASGICAVYESRDPRSGEWVQSNIRSFGDNTNLGVFEMIATDTHLYAGTANLRKGYQLWRTTAEGNPSGGNKYRGLYNIVLKSIGAAMKRHPEVRLDDVIDYGQRMPGPRRQRQAFHVDLGDIQLVTSKDRNGKQAT